MERLVGGVVQQLEQSMNFRRARQGALAANVANADTPGYRRVDISFDSELARASNELKRTSSTHLSGGARDGMRVVRDPTSRGPDGNGVDRDMEVITLTRNAGAFEDQASVLARLFALRRMAATGEL